MTRATTFAVSCTLLVLCSSLGAVVDMEVQSQGVVMRHAPRTPIPTKPTLSQKKIVSSLLPSLKSRAEGLDCVIKAWDDETLCPEESDITAKAEAELKVCRQACMNKNITPMACRAECKTQMSSYLSARREERRCRMRSCTPEAEDSEDPTSDDESLIQSTDAQKGFFSKIKKKFQKAVCMGLTFTDPESVCASQITAQQDACDEKALKCTTDCEAKNISPAACAVECTHRIAACGKAGKSALECVTNKCTGALLLQEDSDAQAKKTKSKFRIPKTIVKLISALVPAAKKTACMVEGYMNPASCIAETEKKNQASSEKKECMEACKQKNITKIACSTQCKDEMIKFAEAKSAEIKCKISAASACGDDALNEDVDEDVDEESTMSLMEDTNEVAARRWIGQIRERAQGALDKIKHVTCVASHLVAQDTCPTEFDAMAEQCSPLLTHVEDCEKKGLQAESCVIEFGYEGTSCAKLAKDLWDCKWAHGCSE